MKLEDISFKRIEREQTREMLIDYHYLHRMPPLSYAYGAFIDEIMVGVLTIGKPPSNSLCMGVCGKEMAHHVYELNRLYTRDDCPKNTESRFISYALSDLKKLDLIIISYADDGMGHCGYVYQATNWIYTGLSAKRTDVYVGKGKHSRTYTEEQRQHRVRKIRSRKHRYLYVCGNKRFKKEVLGKIKYPIVNEYPKGDPSHYEKGEGENPMLYDKISGLKFLEDDYLHGDVKLPIEVV